MGRKMRKKFDEMDWLVLKRKWKISKQFEEIRNLLAFNCSRRESQTQSKKIGVSQLIIIAKNRLISRLTIFNNLSSIPQISWVKSPRIFSGPVCEKIVMIRWDRAGTEFYEKRFFENLSSKQRKKTNYRSSVLLSFFGKVARLRCNILFENGKGTCVWSNLKRKRQQENFNRTKMVMGEKNDENCCRGKSCIQKWATWYLDLKSLSTRRFLEASKKIKDVHALSPARELESLVMAQKCRFQSHNIFRQRNWRGKVTPRELVAATTVSIEGNRIMKSGNIIKK